MQKADENETALLGGGVSLILPSGRMTQRTSREALEPCHYNANLCLDGDHDDLSFARRLAAVV